MKINLKKLNSGQGKLWLLLDGIMLTLILANLTWMMFDSLFTATFFQEIIQGISSDFFFFYRDVIHPDFLLYDFGFVVIFLIEFLLRWGYAVYKKTFPSWVSYPFVFWYDLIGCIPIASFRFLRLFRIISLTIRLQKKEVIDVTDTWWYKFGNRNYLKLLEEISDRVSSNIITGIQKEMEYGEETNTRIIKEVIEPKKEEFARWISSRIQFSLQETYNLHQDDIRSYLDESIKKAVKNNEEINRLEMIPIFGKQISKALASSIADISYNLIDNVINDFSDPASETVINKGLNIAIKTAMYDSGDHELEKISKEITYETLEVIKSQVNKKHYDRLNLKNLL